MFASANGVKAAPIKARDDGKAGALPRNATPSGAALTPFPKGCGQKGPMKGSMALLRCATARTAAAQRHPGGVLRLASGLFDSQRIWQT
jgi:hypothetical protein